MRHVFKFCNKPDFYFICEYLNHHKIDLNSGDDIDALYEQVTENFKCFEISPQFIQNTSYLQAIKDFLKV